MRSESTGGAGLAVPMAWLCAEYTADVILRTGGLVAPGSLEFRAGHRALALTVHLCEGGGADTFASGGAQDTDHWLALTACGHPWPAWVEERLAARAAHEGHGGPDLALATATWHWLRTTEVYAADLGDLEPWHPSRPLPGTVDESSKVWTPAWELGVPLGHLAVHLW
ncbi:hypothetical protein [Streptomyces zhihengii]